MENKTDLRISLQASVIFINYCNDGVTKINARPERNERGVRQDAGSGFSKLSTHIRRYIRLVIICLLECLEAKRHSQLHAARLHTHPKSTKRHHEQCLSAISISILYIWYKCRYIVSCAILSAYTQPNVPS